MNEAQIEKLLFQISNDMAYVKGRLDTLDEIKAAQKAIDTRQDKSEAQLATMQHLMESIHKRQNEMEEEMRSGMKSAKEHKDQAVVSVGICVLSAILSLVSTFLLK